MAQWEWVHIKSSGHYLRKDGKAVIYASRGCSTDENRVEILRILNSHDRLIEALEDIQRMSETDPTNLPPKMFASQIVSRCVAALAAARGEVE